MRTKRAHHAGSSPHTRGAPDRAGVVGQTSGIIPAYAGSTRRGSPRRRSPADHPRMRGEHCTLVHDAFKNTGSSPHTRGAHTHASLLLRAGGIIPAYAGSTERHARRPEARPDHPRIRGEHHRRTQDREGDVGIIPAYAGSTTTSRTPPRVWPDHPRIRGEHSPALMPIAGRSGSSPHTRGAL